MEAIADEQTLRKGIGRSGYGLICFLKALIYKNAQQIASIPELLRDLESRPLICDMIGFPFGKLPDSSNFYRFLNGHKNSGIQELLYKSNKLLLEKDLITTDIIIAEFLTMGDREAEQTSHFNYLSIRNQISIAHLTLSLTALAVLILKRPDKIRWFRAFADAA